MASNAGGLTQAAPVVSVRGLRRSFPGRAVLCGIDLDLHRGEFVALLGKSGSGKSTLLRALAELDGDAEPGPARSAAACADRLLLPERRSVVFQDARLLPWARVLDNVILGLHDPRARELGRAALAEVGLADREHAWPLDLSGGEQQRVALARSLVREPELLLLDEPFGALDALTRLRMHQLLGELCARHEPAVLLVTHDVDEAIELADRVLLLDAGKIAFELRIELGAPRSRRSPHFLDYREALLSALGVSAPSSAEEASALGVSALRAKRFPTRLERTA